MVMGFIPKLDSKVYKNTAGFKHAQRQLRNAALQFFFEPLVEAAKVGGFYLELFGKVTLLKPVIAAFTVDGPEAAAINQVRDSCFTALPCGQCMVTRRELCNPLADSYPQKLQRDIEAVVRPLVEIIERRQSGSVKQARDALKASSLQDDISPLWQLPFGGHTRGLNSAVNPDLLHQYSLGMVKDAVNYTFELLHRCY